MTLRLSRAQLALLQSETEAAFPRECCGLLLGEAGTGHVSAVHPATNVAADPEHRFEIDPAALLTAHKLARAGGPAIIGHYHSHPHGPDGPSETDAAMAQANGELWLIIGPDGAARAWRAGPGGALHGLFEPVEIALAPESGLARTASDRH